MDIIHLGVLFDRTDPENPTPKTGWHVDSSEEITGAQDYLVSPNNPKHFFSGVEYSYRYCFPSKKVAELYAPTVSEEC